MQNTAHLIEQCLLLHNHFHEPFQSLALNVPKTLSVYQASFDNQHR